ncbi:hypothetical protein ACFFJ8_21120 [Paenibacillus mendelii]|uniref:Uncharacterized protein n=1 Tax=Paenibacillus mendelii TaxID=206163 RepID=A0ABV6JD76_9BACL
MYKINAALLLNGRALRKRFGPCGKWKRKSPSFQPHCQSPLWRSIAAALVFDSAGCGRNTIIKEGFSSDTIE